MIAHQFYIDDLLLPITPSKLQMKIKGKNETLTLLNGNEINVLKLPGLTEISFDATIPQVKYPFSFGNEKAATYLNKFEELKTSKKAFVFIIIRVGPPGKPRFNTCIKVSLEDYTIEENANSGLDLTVSIKLKQYQDYGTKVVKIVDSNDVAATSSFTATVESQRNSDSAPKVRTYTVVKGDCLWNIAKKQLGNGARYMEIFNLNKNKIKNPSLIYPGQILTMPT